MKKAIYFLAWLCVLLPVVSAFLWAAFDIIWWVPAEGFRAMGLVSLHILVFVFGVFFGGVVETIDEKYKEAEALGFEAGEGKAIMENVARLEAERRNRAGT